MLFINAAAETGHDANPLGEERLMKSAMERLKEYLPVDISQMSRIMGRMNSHAHPDLVMRIACCEFFKPWDTYFDMFMKEEKISQSATLCGMAIKKHTIVQPWPYKIRKGTTKKEFDILRASCTTGFERYMEFQRLGTTSNDVSVGLGNMQL
jgi:hypothetical protein